jgi:hypothetical protein
MYALVASQLGYCGQRSRIVNERVLEGQPARTVLFQCSDGFGRGSKPAKSISLGKRSWNPNSWDGLKLFIHMT